MTVFPAIIIISVSVRKNSGNRDLSLCGSVRMQGFRSMFGGFLGCNYDPKSEVLE